MKNWIAVASAENVRNGRAQGFMQVCHGKGAPLRRLKFTEIIPLLNQLDFTKNKKNWGYQFRFGLLEISEHDMQQISIAMRTNNMKE